MTSPKGRLPYERLGLAPTKRTTLDVAALTIRDCIRSGKLTGRPEDEGVQRT